tara:strand:+ start:1312 stop:1698 length:387 start_codon:yes stop_codon:yes gene_type:complete
MAYETVGIDLGMFTASADLSAKQYYYVKMSGDNTVTVCAAITDKPIGVLQNKPASGEQAIVRCFGVSKVSADATLAAGDIIGTSADGQAQPITVGSEATVHASGQALTGGAADTLQSALITISNARGL